MGYLYYQSSYNVILAVLYEYMNTDEYIPEYIQWLYCYNMQDKKDNSHGASRGQRVIQLCSF